MTIMTGWKQFQEGFPWFEGEQGYPLKAYSEFMPPPVLGFNPHDGSAYPWLFSDSDPYGWRVLEMEEELQLRPGLKDIGQQVMKHIIDLGKGLLPPALAGHKHGNLLSNPYWPSELAAHAGKLDHEKYVVFLPTSLSKTRDDKGRNRWTFFGASEQGPEKAFWRSFYLDEKRALPEADFISFCQKILDTAFGLHPDDREQLRSLGFRILPSGDSHAIPYWNISALPSWTNNYLVTDNSSFEEVKFLLTFKPFSLLPQEVKEKYLSGRLFLLPFPGSLLLWGNPAFLRLQKQFHTATQFPMLRLVRRNEGPGGLRVPQSGWLHEPRTKGEKAEIIEELLLNTYIRTNRWDRVPRHEDSLPASTQIDPVVQTLFDTTLKALDLYNKPMARNCQLITEQYGLLLDGPKATLPEIEKAASTILMGGLFLYRFFFPPMRVGKHEVFWHRPLVACVSHRNGNPEIFDHLLSGYMTGYQINKADPSDPVELWPRIDRRVIPLAILNYFDTIHDHYHHQTALNLMMLYDMWEINGKKPLERAYARRLIRIQKTETLEQWLSQLSERSTDPAASINVKTFMEGILEPSGKAAFIPKPITFGETANRSYEEAYWKQIHFLAHGRFINKDNADVVQDAETLKQVNHSGRDLHQLGDWLMEHHHTAIAAAGMENEAETGELPFRWETDFDFNGFGGWNANQDGSEFERNILVIIPGKNRNEAVIMADHYDTAYMEDVYDTDSGGTGARIAAAGADDNHSATTTLLLAAPIFLKMAKEGKLERDIWLLHLTGEEFPSDCMGARNFCRNYVQKTLKMRRCDGSFRDLSKVNVAGVFVMDMIAHNRDNARDIFQIAPGRTIDSIKLGYQAHLAARTWNVMIPQWNTLPERATCIRGQRVKEDSQIPKTALHLPLEGEVRPWEDPHSTLYNTDGIIFSDSGIPVVLFMENYDIHRTGYHDTHDTMKNIDLDYGAAVSAIAIETVAQVAGSI
ncbi:MAG: M28 family peptidase [Bacteroidales bacterium]|nr:M28 family peptidase [Bacteroidales bacterium]